MGWGANVKSIMRGEPAQAMASLAKVDPNAIANLQVQIDELNKKLDSILEQLKK